LRTAIRVIVSRRATPSAMSPAIWAVSTGARDAESATDAVSRLPPPWLCPAAPVVVDADGLAIEPGEIAGNRPEALPAPTSKLETPLRSGTGPSGTTGSTAAPTEAELPGEADAAVTVTLWSAEGGVHFAVVTMLAVAVSCTELTELAPEATGICAFRSTALVSDTELMVQVAVWSPLVQPLLNVGFWLDGCAESVTETFAADPFCVETVTS
jgi:hypothetical protein